jgi:hypothetical protein
MHSELVHNLSDLSQQRIIWARGFDPESDLPVANYYTGRQVWLLEADLMQLKPYLIGDATTQPATQPGQRK